MNKEIKEYMRQNAIKGGKALWKDIPPEERSRIMSERRKKGLERKKLNNL